MRVFTFLLFTFLLFQCKNEWLEVQKLQNRVEAVHDEPMAKMDVLEKYQKMAANAFSNIDSTDIEQKNRRAELGNFIIQSQKANDAMFDWMAQYEAPDEKKMDAKTATVYLNDQLEKANSMRNAIFSAIEKGEKLVGQSAEKR